MAIDCTDPRLQMPSMHLLTALALFLIIPSILGMIQNNKDQPCTYMLVATALIGIVFAIYDYVPALRNLAPHYGFVMKFLAVAAISLSVILALRLKNNFLSGLMCTASGMILLMAFYLIRHGLYF